MIGQRKWYRNFKSNNEKKSNNKNINRLILFGVNGERPINVIGADNLCAKCEFCNYFRTSNRLIICQTQRQNLVLRTTYASCYICARAHRAHIQISATHNTRISKIVVKAVDRTEDRQTLAWAPDPLTVFGEQNEKYTENMIIGRMIGVKFQLRCAVYFSLFFFFFFFS